MDYPPYKVRFGYKNVILSNKRRIVEIDETAKPFALEILKIAAEGNKNYTHIMNYINPKLIKAGLKPFKSKSTVEEMIKDPFYYGYFKYNGKLYKGSYSPLISK